MCYIVCGTYSDNIVHSSVAIPYQQYVSLSINMLAILIILSLVTLFIFRQIEQYQINKNIKKHKNTQILSEVLLDIIENNGINLFEQKIDKQSLFLSKWYEIYNQKGLKLDEKALDNINATPQHHKAVQKFIEYIFNQGDGQDLSFEEVFKIQTNQFLILDIHDQHISKKLYNIFLLWLDNKSNFTKLMYDIKQIQTEIMKYNVDDKKYVKFLYAISGAGSMTVIAALFVSAIPNSQKKEQLSLSYTKI